LDKVTGILFEWTFHFIKNKDVLLKKIVKIEEYVNQDYISVEYKDKKMVYYVIPFIEDFGKSWDLLQEIKKKTESSDSCIVMFNSEDNLGKVIENWGILDKDPKLQLIFANPYSLTDKRWAIMPHTHSKIIEPSALKSGLKSLFIGVDPISKNTMLKMTKME
jgi:hypothetical protein